MVFLADAFVAGGSRTEQLEHSSRKCLGLTLLKIVIQYCNIGLVFRYATFLIRQTTSWYMGLQDNKELSHIAGVAGVKCSTVFTLCVEVFLLCVSSVGVRPN